MYDVRSRHVGGQIAEHGRTTCRRPADKVLMYLQHGGRVTKRLATCLVIISDDELLSATQLLESTEDLWYCDVSVDELVAVSQQFDVFSFNYVGPSR